MTASARLNSGPIEPAEDERLAALDRYDILDTPAEAAFDSVAELIRNVFDVKTGFVSLIDGHRQWHKAVSGEWGPERETPVVDTLCRLTILGDQPLVVQDAHEDARFKDSPSVVGEPFIRFYAGVPLRTPDGFNVGTICAIDSEPRVTSKRETVILETLSRLVMETLELRRLVTIDGLTGIRSRHAFKEEAARFIALARRHRNRLSTISFDLDHFKTVNDTYGHAAGDRVLRELAAVLQPLLRKGDLFGRLGGDEFAILLPDADIAAALAVSDKLCRAARELKFAGFFPPLRVTASFGVAMLDPGADDLERLLEKADTALYEAKKHGRNRCESWVMPDSEAKPAMPRRRVLKAGRLIFNDRRSTIDCTVRGLSEDGAELHLSTTTNVPDSFTLRLRADGFEWPCKVIDRLPERLDVQFG